MKKKRRGEKKNLNRCILPKNSCLSRPKVSPDDKNRGGDEATTRCREEEDDK
jgi:hypothetical protein